MPKVKGLNSDTPKNILFGACTIHKNFDIESFDTEGTLIGATSGGSKLSIVPEYVDIEVDGATVKVKGLKKKVGETGTLEINSAEFNKEILKAALLANEGTTDKTGYTLLETKSDIEEGDYWDNITLIGELLDGRQVVVIMENAICTSGLEIDAKKKEAAVPPITFECHADVTDDTLDKLPIYIYYEDISTTTA